MRAAILLLALAIPAQAGEPPAAPAGEPPAAPASEPLSLRDAVATALRQNPTVRAAAAGETAATARLGMARAGYLPRLDYVETVERGDNPVYVFGSLLTQHQFTAANFDLGILNRPEALTNFRSALLLEQTIYDAGRTRLGIRAADLGRQMASQDNRRTSADTILAVVRAYYGTVLAGARLRAAEDAVSTARADLGRAQARRDAGLTTDADVLSIRVHLAAMQERRIRAANELRVAEAVLNEALGQPLDTAYVLPAEFPPARMPADPPESYETAAVGRPEGRQADLAQNLARTSAGLARSAFLPQVSFRSGFELDRQSFGSRGGANWMAGFTLRFNLLNGGADRARLEEAQAAELRAGAERERTHTALRLEARRAALELKAAKQRVEVAAAAVEEAVESHRIIQNRYQAGLSTVTDLLRASTALLEARTQRLVAVHDQRVAAARLEYAAGHLTPDSEVLQ